MPTSIHKWISEAFTYWFICECELFRLYHIYLFFYFLIKESNFDNHLLDLTIKVCHYRKHNLNGLEHCCKRKYLVIVNTIMLMIFFGNQIGFIGLHLSIFFPFSFEYLFTPYEFNSFKWINKCPYTIDLHGLHLEFHDFKLFFRVGSLCGIHVGDRIFIVPIEFNRITISNQETIVFIWLTWYSTRSP